MKKLPILSISPVVALFYASYFSDQLTFNENFIEYEFSPLSMKLVTKLEDEFLRPIETKFAEGKGDEPYAL